MRRRSRAGLFWGVCLVSAGVVALAIQQGMIPETILGDFGQWWPVVLIAIGVAIAFGGSAMGVAGTVVAGALLGLLIGSALAIGPTIGIGCGGSNPDTTDVLDEGTFAAPADVTVRFNCGSLTVESANRTSWSVAGGGDGLDRIHVDSDGASLTVDNGTDDTGLHAGQRQSVDVMLPSGAYGSLEAEVNAAESTFALGGSTFNTIDLELNAGELTVDLADAVADRLGLHLNAGAATITVGDEAVIGAMTLSVNAGSVELCVPDNIGLEVNLASNPTFSHNLDDAGLTQSGTRWRTANFESASNQIRIDLSGNAASFTLNPDGGCK